MGEALKVLVGHDAQGLSASTVSRLKSEWANEYQHWREAPLDEDRWAYVWVDGIYSGLRSEKDKLCNYSGLKEGCLSPQMSSPISGSSPLKVASSEGSSSRPCFFSVESYERVMQKA